MKNILKILFLLISAVFISISANSQESAEGEIRHKVIKQNGVAFVGKIISQDAREVLIETEEVGQVYIPKHEIKEILILEVGQKTGTGDLFATRYFLTTNGFPVKKGENYVQWNLFGPDFQFGVADNFGLGIMTSWVGIPIIGTAKYSIKLGENLNGGLGFLGGTGSWALPRYGLVLPFGFLTLGNKTNNINISAGYAGIFLEESVPTIINEPTDWATNYYEYNDVSRMESRPLLSLAGMFRINSKFSFVFDSFFMLKGKDYENLYIDSRYDELNMKETFFIRKEISESEPLVVLSPGLRFQANENSSFQFGFTGIHVDGEFVPVPIPMVQWFRKI